LSSPEIAVGSQGASTASDSPIHGILCRKIAEFDAALLQYTIVRPMQSLKL
jgi:hypothetical protein